VRWGTSSHESRKEHSLNLLIMNDFLSYTKSDILQPYLPEDSLRAHSMSGESRGLSGGLYRESTLQDLRPCFVGADRIHRF